MDKNQFYKHLENNGINLTDKQKDQFKKYFQLVFYWNERINLTAITDEDEFYTKHFYDSIATSFYFDFKNVKSICDVGSGAGFPSIPLKIIYPHLEVTIVDSLNKRIKFLNLLAEELDLKDCIFVHGRAEDFGQKDNFRESFDVVTARAVARLNVLSELCIPLVKLDGYFLSLKAQKCNEEKLEASKAINVLGGILESDDLFYVEGEERHILKIRKNKRTTKKYPRKAGTPNKNPIL
ncbi:16S rRNA (guanine(527)-N(7))-methyltransferase RsmG [Gemella sp. GH3]|uniref:16S rRNA (guanine(527)-N(7))-methyltransferase RsmG n=1 Tax=unclassified Gemella TaxID=2624949 RepID=UPI0015D029D8|nr:MULTISPECIES: 16S rRNA (guanine(527)-N(7))-methyltransferase RsmG [unclassified Gemella]MBF0713500.1 16S rRNA (guanine(527)-N(7))-methyltransferase RsmG [Gemella sp. GH3.1]NYS50452.1 16S rRNA (guanine(527)-N(7))-methyltransferase RsmG [Gemella sp. GH3]